MWPLHCIQNTPGAELHPDLKVLKPGETKTTVIRVKKGSNADIDSYSAFFDNCKLSETNLNKELKSLNITDLYVCGLAGDVCVAWTSLDALELGYRVVFIDDACRVISLPASEKIKKKLETKGATIVRSDEVCSKKKLFG